MDNNLQIITGEKRITINGDPSRVIVFNPSDVLFVEKFYKLISEFETKLQEYKDEAKRLEAENATDTHGIAINTEEQLTLVRNGCLFIREKIDDVFGAGTSQKAFGDTLALSVFSQFFEGITPFIKTERSAKVTKYTNARQKGEPK